MMLFPQNEQTTFYTYTEEPERIVVVSRPALLQESFVFQTVIYQTSPHPSFSRFQQNHYIYPLHSNPTL